MRKAERLLKVKADQLNEKFVKLVLQEEESDMKYMSSPQPRNSKEILGDVR
jgi:hypothetical protein